MKFTDSHEWVRLKGDTAIVGVTAYAQAELGDIVYVELPKVGRFIKSGDDAAVLESTKAAADVYSPIDGEIIGVNERLKTESGLINLSPEDEGWIFKLTVKDLSQWDALMDLDAYHQMIGQ